MTETSGMAYRLPINRKDAYRGDARLFRLDPPMQHQWDKGDPIDVIEYVIVSAAVTPFFSGTETYVLAADEDGNVVDWCELPGSFQGGLDHEAALEGAGYVIAPEAIETTSPKAIEGAT